VMDFASVLSDLAAQSDKTVSRETFWYDWGPKPYKALRQRPRFDLASSIDLLVQLTGGDSGSTERPVGGRWPRYPFRANQQFKRRNICTGITHKKSPVISIAKFARRDLEIRTYRLQIVDIDFPSQGVEHHISRRREASVDLYGFAFVPNAQAQRNCDVRNEPR